MYISLGKFTFLCFIAALAGCANVPVKDVMANPDAYLTQFASIPLKPEVAAKLPKNEPLLGFARLEIKATHTEVSTEQKADRVLTSTSVYVNGGNGLVQSYEEISNNGFPFRLNYRLSYRGLGFIKSQAIFVNQSSANMIRELKTVKRFDAISSSFSSAPPLEYEYTFGSQVQIAGFLDGKDVCTWGARKPAKELHGSFEGDAIDVVCENYGISGVVIGKSSFAYLTKYGFSLLLAYTSSSVRNSTTITSVKVQ